MEEERLNCDYSPSAKMLMFEGVLSSSSTEGTK